MTDASYDFVVIGSGPAGQKAAIQAAKAGCSVALVESDRQLGGGCVHRGTIPSKTLRESALRIRQLRQQSDVLEFELRDDIEMATLVRNLQGVIASHDRFIDKQLGRNEIVRVHGRASFEDPHTVVVEAVSGACSRLRSRHVIIATGSVPRHLDTVPVDHEHILDSDSILSMVYLPETLTVLGGGIIASEYASIFATLGVRVTMIDRYPRPLGFLDPELVERFVHGFESAGGRFIGPVEIASVTWDGVSQVVTRLEDGQEIRSDKLMLAAGRVANVASLNLAAAGLELNAAGHIPVDESCRTRVPSIYAAGDVIGPPSLASASMEQGRRASADCLGMSLSQGSATIPMGIYAVPELSTVGLDEAQARKAYGDVLVGRAPFEEIARGQISGMQDGMLKMVASSTGRLLGVQIVGEGATELIHIGQMGLLAEVDVDRFVDNIFNFPTLAEAYRVAALQITGQLLS